MRRTVVDIYAALVCFVSIVCFSIGVGIILYSTVGIAYPSVTLNPLSIPFGDGLSPQEFFAQRAGAPTAPSPPPSPEEQAKRRADATERALDNERRTSLQSLIRWSISSLISLVLFATHWRVLRRGQASAA